MARRIVSQSRLSREAREHGFRSQAEYVRAQARPAVGSTYTRAEREWQAEAVERGRAESKAWHASKAKAEATPGWVKYGLPVAAVALVTYLLWPKKKG